jgi:hypothetical protein
LLSSFFCKDAILKCFIGLELARQNHKGVSLKLQELHMIWLFQNLILLHIFKKKQEQEGFIQVIEKQEESKLSIMMELPLIFSLLG